MLTLYYLLQWVKFQLIIQLIDSSFKRLTKLTDLIKDTNLKNLKCSDNKFITLNNLPNTLNT